MSWSANLPGKCIRWSVAIEPVTAIFIAALGVGNGWLRPEPTGPRTRHRPPQWPGRPVRKAGSVERVAASAGIRRVRVVDGEALRVDPVGEVDGRAGEVREAHPVHHHLHTTEVVHDVAVQGPLVEEQLVAEAGAAAGLHGDAQAEV